MKLQVVRFPDCIDSLAEELHAQEKRPALLTLFVSGQYIEQAKDLQVRLLSMMMERFQMFGQLAENPMPVAKLEKNLREGFLIIKSIERFFDDFEYGSVYENVPLRVYFGPRPLTPQRLEQQLIEKGYKYHIY